VVHQAVVVYLHPSDNNGLNTDREKLRYLKSVAKRNRDGCGLIMALLTLISQEMVSGYLIASFTKREICTVHNL
jgi:hypothetical protein